MKIESIEKPLISMVDYIRVTFKTNDVDSILENVVHLNKDFMKQEFYGFYGYVGMFQMDYIKVFYSAPNDNRGICVEMSGQGCRQFEAFLNCRKKTWFDFFQDCLNNEGSFTRLDVAIDDRKTYFSIPELLKKAMNGECISRFRKSDYNGSFDLNEGLNGGTTIYFGSKKSEAYLCFYEKNYEQSEKYNIPLDEIGDWNRYEIRLKNARAQEAIKALLKQQDLTHMALRIVSNYVRFVDRNEEVNRESWKTSAFWSDFIGDIAKLSLYVKPSADFYLKSKNWLQSSCAPTMKMVLKADEILFSNQLSDMILNAELSEKQEKMLSVYLADINEMVV